MSLSEVVFVHVTVTRTPALNEAPVRHVSPKSSDAGVAVFTTFQMFDAPSDADMSFDSSCGRISFTGMETSFAPIPEVVKFWFSRSECKDEPGKRCEPSASRSTQSNTQVVPAFCVMCSRRENNATGPP